MLIRKISIFNRLVLAFVAVGLLTGVPLVLLAIQFFKASSALRLEQGVSQQMEIVADNFRQEFSIGLLRAIKQITESDALGRYLSSSRDERIVTAKALETNLLRLKAEHASYSGIYYVDAEGEVIVSVVDQRRDSETANIGGQGGAQTGAADSPTRESLKALFSNIRTTPLLLSAGNMEWFMPPREVSVIGPFTDEQGRLSFLAGMPLLDFDSGGFGGVVFIRVLLDEFTQRLQSVKFFDESPLWVYSTSGALLLRPPNLSAALDPTAFLPAELAIALQIRNSDEGLMAFKDLTIVKGRPFIRIAYAIPTTAMSKDYESANYFFMGVLLLSVIAVSILAFAVSKKFSTPIIELANAASRLADGGEATQVDVRSSGEIQTLVESFNKMSSKLQLANQTRANAFEVLRNTITQMQSDRIALPSRPATLHPGAGGTAVTGLPDESEDLLAITQVIDNLIHEREENLRNVRLAHEFAEAANRAKSDFLATMSHEIRTPLNAVIGLADVLGNSALTTEQRHLVKTMESSGGQLLQIINDVLDFSRLQSGHAELSESATHLPTFINRLTSMIGGLPNASHLQIRSAIEPSVPHSILTDDARLMQILTNLMGNAVKFTPQGEVAIDVRVDGTADSAPEIRFTVSDTGPGIPDDLRDQIFEPFSQGVAERLRPHAGSGLGLAICRRLASAMGGRLELKESTGSGACFELSLPLRPVAVEGQDRQPDRPDGSGGRPLRILVAEDTPANQLVIRLILEGLGHEVSLASNGQEAVDAFARESFDIVLLDIQMPVMDGYEAATRIRQTGAAGRTVPIVALTAFTQNSDRDTARGCGMSDFVSKPIRAKDIADMIRRCRMGGTAIRPALSAA